MKLNISAFALAFGIWWGVGIFIVDLVAYRHRSGTRHDEHIEPILYRLRRYAGGKLYRIGVGVCLRRGLRRHSLLALQCDLCTH